MFDHEIMINLYKSIKFEVEIEKENKLRKGIEHMT